MTLGPLDNSILPAAVRDAGPQRQREYKAALGFEQQLVAQLAKALSKTAQPAEDSASAATQTYRDMLPDTLANAITASGGLGLAAQLDQSMHGGAK